MIEKFIDRQEDLAHLKELYQRPGAQLVAVYGRRRIGKTRLLLHWAEQYSHIHWTASELTPVQLRRDLTAKIWSFFHPGEDASLMPTFDMWRPLFHYLAEQAGKRRVIVILDELPHAIAGDPALASELQNSWDLYLQQTNIFLCITGSHLAMMLDLFRSDAPLYGRCTAQLPVRPLPFAALRQCFPRWSARERVAVYAILGGVPAYWAQFSDAHTVAANVRRELMDQTGIMRSEALYIIQELVREPRNYLSTVRSVAEGRHTVEAIARATGFGKSHVSVYLDRLNALGLVERRLPALMPPHQRERSNQGRHYLTDPFLRFYFAYIAPQNDLLDRGKTDLAWKEIEAGFGTFIGAHTWQELCQEWAWAAGSLPFVPQRVGTHWQGRGGPAVQVDEDAPSVRLPGQGWAPPARGAQIDVAAVNWAEQAAFIGECKWERKRVDVGVLLDLLDERGPAVVATLPDSTGLGWTVCYGLFSRSGFTPATEALAAERGVQLVDLARLDQDLTRAADAPPHRPRSTRAW